jgi:hypothetical protein
MARRGALLPQQLRQLRYGPNTRRLQPQVLKLTTLEDAAALAAALPSNAVHVALASARQLVGTALRSNGHDNVGRRPAVLTTGAVPGPGARPGPAAYRGEVTSTLTPGPML